MRIRVFLLMMFCFCACNCTEKNEGISGEGNTDKVETVKDVTAYVTTSDMKTLFRKSSFSFTDTNVLDSYNIKYDKNSLGKEIDGFGLAVTTAVGYNLMMMDPADRTKFLTEMFSRTEGVGSSLIRVAIGASDFCLKEEYTWCDKPGLENFAVHAEDRDFLFPILKEIYAINPDVKIIASPWSCPKWMKCQMPGGNSWDASKFNVAVTEEKDLDSWTGGRLKPSCYQVYADYFVKWVQTMEKEGFDIFALTMQNEPLNPGNSMSLVMPWQDQKEFVKVLGPAMEKAGLGDVKILLFDHNFNYDDKSGQDNYPLNIYADPEAYKWSDGSAWHSYGGSVTELDEIYATYPEKSIYFTEASIGEWNYKFSSCLMNDFSSLFLGTLKRGGSGVTLWNMMLDDRNGPYSPQDGSCKTCYGGVTIKSSDYKTISKNSHWYNVAHASAVVKPGARRMETSGFDFPDSFECEMFLNPDNTVGVLMLNGQSSAQQVIFVNDEFTVKYNVPAGSLVSLIWQE
ncbi:MAG: glucosylceramidase [Bacteroidales bacterium]|nr:glucosylceramidase [Bacteroidales bacterium]